MLLGHSREMAFICTPYSVVDAGEWRMASHNTCEAQVGTEDTSNMLRKPGLPLMNGAQSRL